MVVVEKLNVLLVDSSCKFQKNLIESIRSLELPLNIISAYTKKEALSLIKRKSDIRVILVADFLSGYDYDTFPLVQEMKKIMGEKEVFRPIFGLYVLPEFKDSFHPLGCESWQKDLDIVINNIKRITGVYN